MIIKSSLWSSLTEINSYFILNIVLQMKLKNVITTKQEKLLSEKVSFDGEECGL